MHLQVLLILILQNDSIGKDKDGNDVFFNDIWPSTEEIKEVVQSTVTPELFRKEYATCI